MWIWQECEDYTRASGDVKIVDDWGAAAMRCVELARDAEVFYEVRTGGVRARMLSIRYRSDEPGSLRLSLNGRPFVVELQPTEGKRWQWLQHPSGPEGDVEDLRIACLVGRLWLDGFFVHDEELDLPERVDVLDRMVGELEARSLPSGGYREWSAHERARSSARLLHRLPSRTARDAVGDLWPCLGSLAAKPCPYLVSPFDLAAGTDYNADYCWHLLDKEKRWDHPASATLGVVNPNSDVYFAIGFGVQESTLQYEGLSFRPLLHLQDLAIYEVELGEGLRCEVLFRCSGSSTLIGVVAIGNIGDQERCIVVGGALGKDPLRNPPLQRYTLPGQKFGAGVTTTAGDAAWRGSNEDGAVARVCFHEWVRGRCRGRRLLATLAGAVRARQCDFDFGEAETQSDSPSFLRDGAGAMLIRPGETAQVRFALNLRRFTLGDTWNPEITPELYRAETEQEAVEAGYRACVEALEDDLEEAIKRSIEPYRTFPKVTLPIESWEADFYACLELPRASTFSPYRKMKTPFYNFCRVHAHEPFGWWSYGMHAHESLCTLFQNIVDPRLSQHFLLGHIRHQRENGMYPYGVSHGTNPRLQTEEATAPLIVWEAWNAYLWSGDIEFLSEAYESGKRSHEWWLRERDRCGEGLCHWLDTCNESVRDDADLATWVATGGSQNQEALDLNCYLLVQERTLAEMAGEIVANCELGKGERDALPGERSGYTELADRRARLMNAYMWHEEDRCYYGINEVEPGWARVKDISTFFPLWAKLAPRGRFERIVELVTDTETFGTPYGPPSLAADEPGFGPEAHWKGANWVEMTMFVIAGLKNYGYYKLAADLAYRNTKMVFDELERHGHFREYFNSVEGNGVDLIDYIWTAMPAHFIVNVFFGIEPMAQGLSIMPSLPVNWSEISIERVHVRGKRVSVSVRLDESVMKTRATIDDRPVPVAGNRGVFIPWSELADGTSVEVVQPCRLTETHAAPPEAPLDWSDVTAHLYPRAW